MAVEVSVFATTGARCADCFLGGMWWECADSTEAEKRTDNRCAPARLFVLVFTSGSVILCGFVLGAAVLVDLAMATKVRDDGEMTAATLDVTGES